MTIQKKDMNHKPNQVVKIMTNDAKETRGKV